MKGYALYVSIQAAVMRKPLTREEIGEATGHMACLNDLLPRMVEAGLIHVHSKTGRSHRMRWGFDGYRCAPVTRSTLLAYAIIWEALAKPCTTLELCLKSGQSTVIVSQITKKMREAGIAHIHDYVKAGRTGLAPRHITGKGKDCPRPEPVTARTSARTYRRRQLWGAGWADMVNTLSA